MVRSYGQCEQQSNDMIHTLDANFESTCFVCHRHIASMEVWALLDSDMQKQACNA